MRALTRGSSYLSQPQPIVVADESDEGRYQEGYSAVPWTDSIYDATLVAAFHGVRWWPNKRADPVGFHPFLVWVLAFFTYAVQYSLLLYFKIDLDFTSHVTRGIPDLVVRTQMLLILIVQFSFFTSLHRSMRCILFVLNPTTWYDIETPKWRCLSPWPIIALYWKTVIVYDVSSVSSSIILASNTVKDSIFDCLSLEFIVLFDTVVWEFCKVAFDLSFHPSYERKRRFKEGSNKVHCSWPLSLLRSGSGGRRCEEFFSSCILVVLYMRQFFQVQYAFDTDVLPAARTLCTRWRWLNGTGSGSVLAKDHYLFTWKLMVSGVVGHFLYDPYPDLAKKADPAHGGICDGNINHTLTLSGYFDLAGAHPAGTLICSSCLVVIVFLGPVMHCAGVQHWRCWRTDSAEEDEENSGYTEMMPVDYDGGSSDQSVKEPT